MSKKYIHNNFRKNKNDITCSNDTNTHLIHIGFDVLPDPHYGIPTRYRAQSSPNTNLKTEPLSRSRSKSESLHPLAERIVSVARLRIHVSRITSRVMSSGLTSSSSCRSVPPHVSPRSYLLMKPGPGVTLCPPRNVSPYCSLTSMTPNSNVGRPNQRANSVPINSQANAYGSSGLPIAFRYPAQRCQSSL